MEGAQGWFLEVCELNTEIKAHILPTLGADSGLLLAWPSEMSIVSRLVSLPSQKQL